MFVRDIVGARVADIILDTKKAKQIKMNVRKPVVETPYEDKIAFLSTLKSVQPKTVGLHLFEEFNENFKCPEVKSVMLPRSLKELPVDMRFPEPGEYTFDQIHIKLTDEETIFIEEATRNQSHSKHWFEQRVGRITGSIVGEVSKATERNKTLVGRICKKADKDVTSSMLFTFSHLKI